MKNIFDFAQGKLTYDEFEVIFESDPDIWKRIQSLVPADIAEPTCEFRNIYPNMCGFETNNYNVKDTIMSFGYAASHILAHSLISTLVKYNYPDIVVKDPPSNSAEDVLDKLKLEYLSGNEVDEIIKDTFCQYSDNKKELKKALKELFHLSRKHPDWVQEPEWPMGKSSPMEYIGCRENGEKMEYDFKDVDTGEIKTVEQFY